MLAAKKRVKAVKIGINKNNFLFSDIANPFRE
jgi:hypothetical protein